MVASSPMTGVPGCTRSSRVLVVKSVGGYTEAGLTRWYGENFCMYAQSAVSGSPYSAILLGRTPRNGAIRDPGAKVGQAVPSLIQTKTQTHIYARACARARAHTHTHTMHFGTHALPHSHQEAPARSLE